MSRSLVLLSLTTLLTAVEVEPAKLATADAAPVDPGALEIAFGLTHTQARTLFDADRLRQDRGSVGRETALGLGLTYGVMENLDVGVGLGVARVQESDGDPDHGAGLQDVDLGAKWAFWSHGEGDRSCAVALLPGITIPTGTRDDTPDTIPTGSRAWAVGLTLATSGQVGPWSLNADIGQSQYQGSEEDREGTRGSTAANGAIGLAVTPWLQPEVDLSWSQDQVEEGDAPWAVTLTAGAQVTLESGRLSLGLAQVIAGAQDTDATLTLLAGFAIIVE